MGSKNRQRARLSFALLLLVLGCGNPRDDANKSAAQKFEAFAQELYSELQRRPIAQREPVQIGLFGDLNVLSGENVVMGRYRYRVDTTDGVPAAHMAFVMRGDGRDVPVILSFSPSEPGWQLDETRFLSEDNQNDSLRSVLQSDLKAWVSGAVDSVNDGI